MVWDTRLARLERLEQAAAAKSEPDLATQRDELRLILDAERRVVVMLERVQPWLRDGGSREACLYPYLDKIEQIERELAEVEQALRERSTFTSAVAPE